MERVSRTCCCKKCGSVKFRIIPEVGSVNYECVECGYEVGKRDCEMYMTLIPTCCKCSSDEYKVWIDVDKESGNQTWYTTCEKCNEEIETALVDSDGKIISEKDREILILKDKIEELEEELEDNDYTMRQLKNENYELESQVEIFNVNLYQLKDQLNRSKRYIDDLEYKIRDLESQV